MEENQHQHQQSVFRGHLGECIKHLAECINQKIPRGSHGANKAKEPIAQFCKVTTATVQRWFKPGGISPIGESLIRLVCYLQMLGYQVIEFEEMSQSCQGYLELIGFDIISAQEATGKVGYAKFSTLCQVFFGENHSISSKKETLMYECWKAQKTVLEKKKQVASKRYRLQFAPASSSEKLAPVASGGKRGIFAIMEGLRAELIEGEPFTQEELQQNATTILGLSGYLVVVCAMLIKDRQKGRSDGP